MWPVQFRGLSWVDSRSLNWNGGWHTLSRAVYPKQMWLPHPWFFQGWAHDRIPLGISVYRFRLDDVTDDDVFAVVGQAGLGAERICGDLRTRGVVREDRRPERDFEL